jgi:DNA-binding transcriptional LysR family regulator
MEWGDVRVFLAALRTGKIRRAAAQLGMERSTASRRLTALERDLGARLFVRTRDGLRPTPAAERLRAPAERMEAGAAELARAGPGRRGDEPRGVVRVATTEALATYLAAHGLLELRDEHPAVVIHLLAGNAPVDIPGDADVGVRVSRVQGGELRVRCVARFPIGLFASGSYVRSRGRPTKADALAGHDVLLPSQELANLPEAKWLAARPGVRVALRANSMSALIAAAAAGKGVVPLPAGWGHAEALEQLFTLEHVPRRPLWIVTHASAVGNAAVRAVADRIAVVLKGAGEPVR